MDASSIITQVSRDDEQQLNSFPSDKGIGRFHIKITFSGPSRAFVIARSPLKKKKNSCKNGKMEFHIICILVHKYNGSKRNEKNITNVQNGIFYVAPV
jgi:hypothetical protein